MKPGDICEIISVKKSSPWYAKPGHPHRIVGAVIELIDIRNGSDPWTPHAYAITVKPPPNTDFLTPGDRLHFAHLLLKKVEGAE